MNLIHSANRAGRQTNTETQKKRKAWTYVDKEFLVVQFPAHVLQEHVYHRCVITREQSRLVQLEQREGGPKQQLVTFEEQAVPQAKTCLHNTSGNRAIFNVTGARPDINI